MALFQKEDNREKKIEELSSLIQKKRMNIKHEDKAVPQKQAPGKKEPEKKTAPKAPPQARPVSHSKHTSKSLSRSKSFNKENIKFTAFPSSYTGEKNSLKEIDEKMRSIFDKDVGRFSGKMTVSIEQNKIVNIEMHKVETDEDITDKLITKDQFESLMKYYEDPDSVRHEIANLAKGLDKEQLLHAIDMGAEAIIKKVRLKADGAIEYNFIASVKK